jgi:hypothetical protein
MQNSQIDEVEDEDLEIKFNHFNSEINLLSINILLESFYRGEDVLTLGDFIKGDYWKVEEIFEEITDAHDYSSPQDLVLAQIIHIIDDFDIGKVKTISVVSLNELLETVIEDAVRTKTDNDNEIVNLVNDYAGVISVICDLKSFSDYEENKTFKKGVKNWTASYDEVSFKPDNYLKDLDYIVHIAAPFIEIKIDYKENGAKKLRQELEAYLSDFSQDSFIDRTPAYREKRYYFSRQLENFVAYINKLSLINGYVNVPFEVLSEKGFEFVKVASYLEDQGKIKVTNWNDKDIWNIKFHQKPITVASLVSTERAISNETNSENLKINLSFDEAKSILNIGDKIVKVRKMKDQYHLLRIIFEDKEELGKEWFFSEIAEKYDSEADLDDKKFYNAAYQVKQAIARDAGLRDILITTTQSVRINPKYLS